MQRAMMVWILGAVAMGALLGCSADVAPDGSSAALTEKVSSAEWEARDLYYDPLVSSRPMTAEELGDTSGATRVRIRFLDNVAIAWAAPAGEPLLDQRDAIIAVYGITPIDGEVRPGTTTPVTPLTPGNLIDRANIGTSVDLNDDGPAADVGLRFTELPDVWVTWSQLFREDPNLIRDLGRYHPGCI